MYLNQRLFLALMAQQQRQKLRLEAAAAAASAAGQMRSVGLETLSTLFLAGCSCTIYYTYIVFKPYLRRQIIIAHAPIFQIWHVRSLQK